MQWRGRRESSNVEDGRSEGPASFGRGGGSGGLGLLMMVGRVFGFKGIVVVVAIGAVLWMAGIVDPSMLISGRPGVNAPAAAVSPEEQERFDFVKVVMADTEDVWTAEFARRRQQYVLPVLKVYRGQVMTGCGLGSAAAGPFYCPADQKIYIDLGFYDELAQTFKSPGDFAQAYVIAHEVGHHVQKLLGTSDKVNAMRGRPDFNEHSVRLELQADFYAGDIAEAMRAANAIGDDAIQKQMQGRVMPHAFTHGTSEQRMRWFNKGLQSGRFEDGDTFSMPYNAL